jgi:hypothetical protein
MTADPDPRVYAPDDELPDARERGDELLRRMHRMPPKPQAEMKLGKPRRPKRGPEEQPEMRER